MHRARTFQALAAAAAACVRAVVGAGGAAPTDGGIGAELAAVARQARALGRLELALVDGKRRRS